MIKGFLTIVFLQSSVVFGLFLPRATEVSCLDGTITQGRVSGFRVREVNVHAPSLYADHIDFIATLKDLPGARHKQSSWELSYQLFFVPEDKYHEALRHAPKGGFNPTPEHFEGRILLAEGHKKKTRLGTLKERTITLNGVPFKQKVPDALRTKFSVLITAYSLKIFDAELNTTVYHSAVFVTDPFEASAHDQKQAVPRKTLYLSFGVNKNGTLNRSQLPP
jgi:hypothetical protein